MKVRRIVRPILIQGEIISGERAMAQGIVGTLRGSHILPVLMGELITRQEQPGFRLRGRAGVYGWLPVLNGSDGRLPTRTGSGVINVVPLLQEDRIVAIKRGDATGISTGLLVILPGLSFPYSGFPMPRRLTSKEHTPHHLIWSGGEGVGVAHRTFGSRKDVGQVQIFAFREGQHIIVADEYERMMEVTFLERSFHLESATEEYLIDHVTRRAEAARNKQELDWCRHVFESIGREDLIAPIQTKIENVLRYSRGAAT